MRFSGFFVFCFFAVCLNLFSADLPLSQIASDSRLRAELKESYLLEAPSRIAGRVPQIHELSGGDKVQTRVEQNAAEITIVLARSYGANYPGWAQGSWVLSRDKRTGEPLRIRIFPRSDPYTFIQLRPGELDKAKTLLDIVVYDAYLVRGAALPISFDSAITAELHEIIEMAGPRFPKKYFEIDAAQYSNIRDFIAGVRKNIAGLEYKDDGALNENNEYVFIATLKPQDASGGGGLNCSGFAKWLIDFLLKQQNEKPLTIEELKEPYGNRGTGITRPWEPLRDPYFGIDWSRNLAAAVQKNRYPGSDIKIMDFEVRDAPFTQIITRVKGSSETAAFPAHSVDAGFKSEGIQALLYTLAVDEPGNFYLASINDDRGGGRPRIRQYFHIAALFPYFTQNGVFHVAVFESAAETQFSNFKARYPGGMINLVRVPVD